VQLTFDAFQTTGIINSVVVVVVVIAIVEASAIISSVLSSLPNGGIIINTLTGYDLSLFVHQLSISTNASLSTSMATSIWPLLSLRADDYDLSIIGPIYVNGNVAMTPLIC
jgi:hypothetical protein